MHKKFLTAPWYILPELRKSFTGFLMKVCYALNFFSKPPILPRWKNAKRKQNILNLYLCIITKFRLYYLQNHIQKSNQMEMAKINQ